MKYSTKISFKSSVSYKIIIENGISKNISSYIKNADIGNFSIVITTRKVYSLYNKQIKHMFANIPRAVICLPNTEKAKSRAWLFRILKEIVKYDTIKRKIFICCIGGGVTGDIGGLSASLYKRGVPYIQVPTTLLAQVDAGIGGKTAIDDFGIKNIIGTFYHPEVVFIDPAFLKTLPERELKQGISEAIKYGIIKDKTLFNFIQNNCKKILNLDKESIQKLLYKSTSIKANIVSRDEKEDKGIRTLLNFGHTTAHAIESILDFKKISHGEAVALGMIQAAYLSKYMGLCSINDVKKVINVITLYGLPTKLSFNKNKLFEHIRYDKKFTNGKIRMVLISKIGRALVKEDISPGIIKRAMQHIATERVE